MDYSHTQKAPLHFVFYPAVSWLLVLAWLCRDQPATAWGAAAGATVLLAVAFMFRYLTVRDAGQWLVIRYGPLPVFGKRIRYADISAVEASRSSLIDGWGMHYIPGRGYTYNLWGFGCAKLLVNGKTVRVGSDDVEQLVAFLSSKIQR
ncbi:MAG: hypothetical protein NTY19_28325 [Planctomycetota bacterium]|nr:hypothetical protein [Planctomycetota bacterium]